MSTERKKWSPATRVTRSTHHAEDATGSVAPPIYPSTTFARGDDYELPGAYQYGRYGTPGVTQAETVLADLENGADALVFGSGMAAISALTETLRRGDRLIAQQVMYHGALDLFRRLAEERGIQLDLFDQGDPGALEATIRKGPVAMVWLENPCNPTWDILDLENAALAAHAAGAVLAVDGTIAPPCTTRALEFGADIVFHSLTKYLNGHSDVTGGALICARADARWEKVRLVRKQAGSVLAPMEAWLLLRGMRTLFVRFERQSASALKIARHFQAHPAIERVLYPGLEDHPGHAMAAKQMHGGFGGMLSILVRGNGAAARRIATACRLFTPATSLGGYESLIEHRRSVEGPHSLVADNLIRLSIGLEDPDDLIADLEQALATPAR